MSPIEQERIEELIETITDEIESELPEPEDDSFEPPETSTSPLVSPSAEPSADELASLIDHTQLKPDATYEQIDTLCKEARQENFASVCVNACHVSRCAQLLDGSTVPVCTVVGFPLGATSTEAKVAETEQAIADGATEIDMVINIGALKSEDHIRVGKDVAAVAQASHKGGALLKVIIEAAMLSDEEKVKACQIAKLAGADFVKTSTGFGPGGATVEDVQLMRQVVGSEMGVKAAGGIHSYEEAKEMIAAGANRIGASAGVDLVQGAKEED